MKNVNVLLAGLVLAGLPVYAAAQSPGIYVGHERVDAALSKGGALIDAAQVKVSGARRDKAGAIPISNDASGTGASVAYNPQNRSTSSGSNWRPAWERSSTMASPWLIRFLYGRSWIMAS